MKKRVLFYLVCFSILLIVVACSEKTTEPEVETVAKPHFIPSGGTYEEAQEVIITCETEGAIIKYTTDGTEPTESSTVYVSPINIVETTTLIAKAFKSGWNDSPLASAVYTIELPPETVATPTFDPPGGAYENPQEIAVTCATEGATIRFTTDGSEPTESSPAYTNPIQISTTTTLKARAFKSGWEPSLTATAEYIITVATPTFDPPGGAYYSPQSVAISCATEGATIRYTTDGSEPTESSPAYTDPIQISTTTTLKARAFKSGWTPSDIAAAQFTIVDPPPLPGMIFVQGTAGVTFNPGGLGYFTPGGSYNVSLSDFYIGKHEVTQAEYEAVMGTNPGSHNSKHGDPLDHSINNVSWFNAIEYCNRLSMMEGLTPAYSYSTYGTNPDNWPAGWYTSNANHTNVSCNWSANGYRLPTEMEREYAARGGVPAQNAGTFNDQWAGTDIESDLVDYAWYRANAGEDLPGGSSHPDYGTHPVGTRLPNELGLYDMSGNVNNWVWDIRSYSYPNGSYTDPTGPESGSSRVRRGGCWYYSSSFCRVTVRSGICPTYTLFFVGFRLCRTSP